MHILEMAITGNIIGLISMLISLVGLMITIFTMNSAKRIENEVVKLKSKAIYMSKLHDFKPNACTTLRRNREAASKADLLTKRACNDILTIIGEMQGFDSIFDSSDNNKILECQQQMSVIENAKELKGGLYVKEFIKITSVLINILEKGEYAL